MRKSLRRWLWSLCWEIGDRFLWYAHKLEDRSGGQTLTIPANQGRVTVTSPALISASTMPLTFTATNTKTTFWILP